MLPSNFLLHGTKGEGLDSLDAAQVSIYISTIVATVSYKTSDIVIT